jgi:predicted dehydrogenase
LGSIGTRHAGLLREQGCRVVGFDPASTATPPQGVELASTEEDALARVQAVLVASPSSEHLRHARLAIDAGCHVLVEKPLADDDGSAVTALVEDARRAGLVLAVAMNLRFHPGPAAVAEHVRAGRVGQPLLGHFEFGSYLPDWRPQTDYRTSYSARKELGGGVLLDVVHELDLGAWILGAPVVASAWMARVSELEIDVEDVVLARVRHAGGATSSYALDYLDRAYRRGCRIVGTEATAVWDWRNGHSLLLRGDEVLDERAATRDFASTYRDEIGAWLDAVRTGAIAEDSPLGRGAEGAELLRLVAAVRRSAADGQEVTL